MYEASQNDGTFLPVQYRHSFWRKQKHQKNSIYVRVPGQFQRPDDQSFLQFDIRIFHCKLTCSFDTEPCWPVTKSVLLNVLTNITGSSWPTPFLILFPLTRGSESSFLSHLLLSVVFRGRCRLWKPCLKPFPFHDFSFVISKRGQVWWDAGRRLLLRRWRNFSSYITTGIVGTR